MRLGFTGTQRGMTAPQQIALAAWLTERAETLVEAHHGDCVGADEQFDDLLELLGVRTVIHPPTINTKRAWCARLWATRLKFGEMTGGTAPHRKTVIELPPRPYLARNRDIAKASSALVAAPGEMVEQLRSGTWATVRCMRKLGRRIRIFWPDGTTTLDGRRAA